MKLPPLPEGNEGSVHHSKNPRAWNRYLTSCNWLRRRPHIGVGMLFRLGATPMETLPERTARHKPKNQPPTIPGGVYMIPPLAAVSVLAAFVMELITWRDLCTWIALWEVRTWRDTREPAQRNIFRFSPRRVAQALGRQESWLTTQIITCPIAPPRPGPPFSHRNIICGMPRCPLAPEPSGRNRAHPPSSRQRQFFPRHPNAQAPHAPHPEIATAPTLSVLR